RAALGGRGRRPRGAPQRRRAPRGRGPQVGELHVQLPQLHPARPGAGAPDRRRGGTLRLRPDLRRILGAQHPERRQGRGPALGPALPGPDPARRVSRAGLAGTLAALVAARLALPALAHPAYGFHRDEVLYFAMADHLDLFRMQFPPFIALAARASRALFGESVLAARVPAALAGTALFALVLGLARRLGGRGWALAFAAVALAAPAYLRASVLFQPVVFDQLWCAAAVTALLLAALGGSPRWWLAAGAALGLGALTKFSVAFYAAGLGAAALAPPRRRHLRTRWPWLGLAIALLLAVPSLSGQAAHGWPFIAQMRTLAGGQLGRVSPAGFLAGQLALLGP